MEWKLIGSITKKNTLMKNWLIYLSFPLVFYSCSRNEKKPEIIDSNSGIFFREQAHDKKLVDSLTNLVLNKGDTLAYHELKTIYYIGEGPTSYFYYAIIMANKYNYKQASYDVYNILTSNTEILDDKTKEMANEYLLKSK